MLFSLCHERGGGGGVRGRDEESELMDHFRSALFYFPREMNIKNLKGFFC